MAGRERFYSCVIANEPSGQESDSVVENELEDVEIQVAVNQSPKSASKKRPRKKTHAKTMIQVRRNYTNTNKKRKDPEPENDLTEVFENLEEDEEDRSPKPKKKKRDTKGEKPNNNLSSMPKNPTPDDPEEDKWTIEAYVSYTEMESSTNNKEIKEIIKCMDMEEMYQKKYHKTKKNIVDYLKAFNQEEKEQIISEVIEYINDEGLPANWKIQKSESQIANIIVALRNRMPNWCTGCNDWYSIKKEDKPRLNCMMCNVGRHECDKNNESTIGTGIVWMCPECIDINIREGLFEKAKDQTKEIIVNKDNKRKRDEIIVAAEIHTEVSKSKLNNAMRARLNSERNKNLNRDKEQGENEVIVVLEEETNRSQNKKHPTNTNTNTRTNNMKSQKTCIYWKKGRCKFEERCWYLHPKKCEDILKFGECSNLECKQIHPKMCINMNERGFCHKGKYCNYEHQLYVKTKTHGTQNKQYIQNNERHEHIGSRKQHRVDYMGERNNNNLVRKPTNYQRHNNYKREYREDFMQPERVNWENNYPRHNNQRKENNENFLRSERIKWEDMKTPMFRYAAEILAEKMMHM